MNHLQKTLLLLLLTNDDHYLMKSSDFKRRDIYKLYKGNQELVRVYKAADYKKLHDVTKKDRKGRLTLNINLIRQLHGKNHIKKTYKLLNTKL